MMTFDVSYHFRNNLKQIALFFVACALFAFGVRLGFVGESASSGMTLGAGVFCLIFAFLSQFKRFKGLGIEAELWEQKQEEAARLVKKLRTLSLVASEQLIGLSARAGRLGGIPHREQFALLERIDNLLLDIDVPTDQRDATKADLHKFTAIDMALPILRAINPIIKEKINDQKRVISALGNPPSNNEEYEEATERLKVIESQEVEWEEIVALAPGTKFLEAIEAAYNAECLSAEDRKKLDSEVGERLVDLRTWINNKRLRRPEFWFAEGSQI